MNNNNSPATEHLANAQQAFAEGDYQECLRMLGWGFREDVNYMPLYRLSADALKELGGDDEAQLFLAVMESPNDAQVYNTLGEFYFRAEHYSMAQAFFAKTLELEPGHELAYHDLSICYARQFQIDKAIEILEPRSKMFWDFYFLYKCKILAGQIEGLEEGIIELGKALDAYSPEEVIVPREKVNELHEMLKRFKLVGKPEMHIRDWHFIQYGTAIIDFFETDKDDYVAGGRYVALWGNNESFKNVAVKLKQFIDALVVSFQKVLSLPDRDSDITGRVIAKELGVEFDHYDPDKPSDHCLIVAAHSMYFHSYEELMTIQEGQVTFALNHNWLEPSMISPDVVGFMSQSYNFPWQELSDDEHSAENIANEISNTETEPEDNSNNLAFYATHKDHLKGIGKLAGDNRNNFVMESPVTGSYFA